MKIIVGSTNPAKIGAVEDAFRKFFDKIEVTGTEISSGVKEQPIGHDETIQGAINRAKESMKTGDYDFSVGMEGGVEFTEHGTFSFGWMAIMNKNEEIGLGKSISFLLPKNIAGRIQNGEELGPILDDITKQTDVKKKGGAIGLFTDNRITRSKIYEDALISAISSITNEYYQNV